jgi:hypothetical protein
MYEGFENIRITTDGAETNVYKGGDGTGSGSGHGKAWT